MLSRPVAFALLAAGCMAAAAGGAYVAQRHNAGGASLTAATTAPATPPVNSDAQVAAQPVETIGRISAPAGAADAAQAPLTSPRRRQAPSRRVPVMQPEPTYTEQPSQSDAERPSSSAAAAEAPAEAAPVTDSAPVEAPAQLSRLEEITIPAETVIGVQVDTAVSSERARVEDRVEGHVTRDVSVNGRVAIPAGTKVLGSVTLVDRGGKFKERARIAVRFHTAQLSDGSRLALQTTAIMREGDSPSRETAAKVGGSAVGGAILGAILGGAKGAVIGGTAGAGAGTAVVMASDRNAATLPAGTTVSVQLMAPVTVTVEK